jgi:hypothetical protein
MPAENARRPPFLHPSSRVVDGAGTKDFDDAQEPLMFVLGDPAHAAEVIDFALADLVGHTGVLGTRPPS